MDIFSPAQSMRKHWGIEIPQKGNKMLLPVFI